MDLIFTMVDVVLLTIHEGRLHVVLVERDRQPKKGVPTIPGGKIEENDDDAEASAVRILRDRAGITIPYLEQLFTYTGRLRDERRWSISVAHYAVVPKSYIDASTHTGLHLFPVDEPLALPFDHNQMVADAVTRVRNKSQYSSLPAHLAGEKFTIAQLHAAYQATMGEPLTIQNFRRKIMKMEFIEPVPGEWDTGRPGAPAELYRLRDEFRRSLRIVKRGL